MARTSRQLETVRVQRKKHPTPDIVTPREPEGEELRKSCRWLRIPPVGVWTKSVHRWRGQFVLFLTSRTSSNFVSGVG